MGDEDRVKKARTAETKLPVPRRSPSGREEKRDTGGACAGPTGGAAALLTPARTGQGVATTGWSGFPG